MNNQITKQERKEIMREKIGNAWKMIHNAITVLVLAYIVWTVANLEIVWKTIRYPEAVKQMQIEVVIKK